MSFSQFVDDYLRNQMLANQSGPKDGECSGCHQKKDVLRLLGGDRQSKQPYCEKCLAEWGVDTETLELYVPEVLAKAIATVSGDAGSS